MAIAVEVGVEFGLERLAGIEHRLRADLRGGGRSEKG
jgi:hypothetical protein